MDYAPHVHEQPCTTFCCQAYTLLDVMLRPQRLENLMYGFLRRLLGSINPESNSRHRRPQNMIEILRPLIANEPLCSPRVPKLRHNIHAWREHYQREGYTLQVSLQLLPTFPKNNVIEYHAEPGLQERPPKQTHVLET